MTANLRGIGLVQPETLPLYVPAPQPYGDIRDRQYNSLGMELFCWFSPDSETCKVPTTEQIITSTSDYGGQLTLEARAAAEELARELVAGDDPCSYSEINGMDLFGKLKCYMDGKGTFPLPDLMMPMLVIGGLIWVSTLKK